MPKLIDHEERAAIIAAASLRVLQRDGLAALSVRNVADEAAIAPASLRRAFSTQLALREYVLTLIEERVTSRIAAINGSGRQLASEVLAQLLPLDEHRREELSAQLQLEVLALTDTTLRDAAARLNDGVARACTAVVAELARVGEVAAGFDLVNESTRLHAVLDGAALHAIRIPLIYADRSRATVEHHLDSLRPR